MRCESTRGKMLEIGEEEQARSWNNRTKWKDIQVGGWVWRSTRNEKRAGTNWRKAGTNWRRRTSNS